MKRKPTDPGEGLKAREAKRKSSVVASMLSAPEPNQEQEPPPQAATVAAPVIKKAETKSRRKQILLQPTVHDRAEEKCKRLSISMNEVVNQLLANWIDQDE